jgi:hypothetical protein
LLYQIVNYFAKIFHRVFRTHSHQQVEEKKKGNSGIRKHVTVHLIDSGVPLFLNFFIKKQSYVMNFMPRRVYIDQSLFLHLHLLFAWHAITIYCWKGNWLFKFHKTGVATVSHCLNIIESKLYVVYLAPKSNNYYQNGSQTWEKIRNYFAVNFDRKCGHLGSKWQIIRMWTNKSTFYPKHCKEINCSTIPINNSIYGPYLWEMWKFYHIKCFTNNDTIQILWSNYCHSDLPPTNNFCISDHLFSQTFSMFSHVCLYRAKTYFQDF